MIERCNNGEMFGSGRGDRNGILIPSGRFALVLSALSALLLAACGTSADTGGDAVTSTTADAVSSVTSTTALDTAVIDPSLVGSKNGTSMLFPENGNGGYYVSVYDWDLALSDDLTSLSGVATITASTTQDLQRFSLDAQGLQVESVTVDDTPAEFSLVDPELVITTSDPLPAGSVFVVRVVYAAEPDGSQLGRFRGWFVVPGEQVYALTQAATWTPLDGDLDGPPARYIMRIDVPDGFTATAVGIPTGEEGSGGVVWDTDRAIYFPTFAVAGGRGRTRRPGRT